jgi:hypothetical protein
MGWKIKILWSFLSPLVLLRNPRGCYSFTSKALACTVPFQCFSSPLLICLLFLPFFPSLSGARAQCFWLH